MSHAASHVVGTPVQHGQVCVTGGLADGGGAAIACERVVERTGLLRTWARKTQATGTMRHLVRRAAGASDARRVVRGHDAFREMLVTMHEGRIRRLRSAGFTAAQAAMISDLHTPNFM